MRTWMTLLRSALCRTATNSNIAYMGVCGTPHKLRLVHYNAVPGKPHSKPKAPSVRFCLVAQTVHISLLFFSLTLVLPIVSSFNCCELYARCGSGERYGDAGCPTGITTSTDERKTWREKLTVLENQASTYICADSFWQERDQRCAGLAGDGAAGSKSFVDRGRNHRERNHEPEHAGYEGKNSFLLNEIRELC